MQHAICIAWFICIWSFVVTYGPTVPVQLSIVHCPRRGTMRLHTLWGMKAENICIAFTCINWSDICRYCWRSEMLYKLLWLLEEMRWYWLYWDYWVLYLQVFLFLIVIPVKCWLIHLVVYISRQNNLLAEMFHLTLALLNVDAWCLSRGVGSSGTLHTLLKELNN
jgi:hypothetical protein